MLRLHEHPASANGLKVRLLLDRLERPYERVTVDIFRGASTTPAFLARNPVGRTPVLELDDGTSLPESGAILLYLAEGTPWLPGDPVGRARVAAWVFFEQNLVEPNVGTARFWALTGRDAQRPEAFAQRRDAGAAALAQLDRHLAGTPYVHGDTETVGDVALYGYAHVAADAGIDLEPLPHLRAWIDRVAAHPRHRADLAPYPPAAMAGMSRGVHG